MKEIYLDSAASTPVDPRVLNVFNEASVKFFGNPSNIKHNHGMIAKKMLEKARKKVGALLGLAPQGIIFTSGATEANNLALRGITCLQKDKCSAIISSIEHACVDESVRFLLQRGVNIKAIPTLPSGIVDLSAGMALIKRLPNLKLISVMLVNNEIGTIQPVEEIIRFAKWRNALVHVDAVQGIGKVNLNAIKQADMVSVSGHKINGPKGVGCLWVRPGLKISPLLVGGGQEFGIRSGTTPVPLILAFAEALNIAINDNSWLDVLNPAMRNMEKTIINAAPGILLNGEEAPRVKSISNISFPFKKQLIDHIDGVALSAGAACGCAKAQPSKVLLSMGLPKNLAKNSIRISANRFTSVSDIDIATQIILKTIKQISV